MPEMTVKPVTPCIGAEVSGLDLSRPLQPDEQTHLLDLINQHHVLFFRGQQANESQLQNLGASLGELHIHPQGDIPGYPGVISVVTNASSTRYAGHAWHTDASCEIQPPRYSILALTETPPSGGDTLFANMHAVYDALSKPMRGFLDTLDALHSGAWDYGEYFGMKAEEMRDGKFPEAIHPVVLTHPDNGRKAIYVNETFTANIEGLERQESDAILALLYQRVKEPDVQCRFSWAPGSIAIWDNFSTQHKALWDYYPHTRAGFRATVVRGNVYR